MKLHDESLGAGRRLTLLAALIALATVVLLAVAARARATETVYWDNYEADSISAADITGSGGGELNLTGVTLDQPEGLAFDPATGRIYSAQAGSNKIAWVNVDGSGGGFLNTTGATIEEPRGVVIDPVTRTIYWANDEEIGSIGFARLDGSGGGVLNTTGAKTKYPFRPGIDTVNRRIYWWNGGAGADTFSSAGLDGSGGSDLTLSGGAPEPKSPRGIDIDPAAGRLYWLDSAADEVLWTNLSGIGGGKVDGTGANFAGVYGLSFDPSSGRFLWGNYSNIEDRTEAIGEAFLSGSGNGGISPVTAPVLGPQDPIVLASPTGITPPQVSQSGAALSCSQGTWAPDYPSSFVYGAPTSYAYQWALNGVAIPGATGPTLTASAAGSYSCSVTGINVTGSATQTAATAATVKPATLSISLQSKTVKAVAGRTLGVKFRVANAGDVASAPIQVCAAKLTKKAKKGLVASKCAAVPALGSGGSAAATLKVKIKKAANGTYKFTTQVKGAPVSPVTVNVKVIGSPKPHRKKH